MWIIEIFIALSLFLFARYGLKRTLAAIRGKISFSSELWVEKFDQILYKPLFLIFVILGTAYLLDVIGRLTSLPTTANQLASLRNAAVVCSLAWFLVLWKDAVQKKVINQSSFGAKPVDVGVVRFLGRLASMLILIITALIVMQLFGVSVIPLVAVGGVGAAAMGFAGKDVLANFFGGLMIYITRPFTIGDQIELPEKNMEGYIEEIGWYLTAVRDKEKRLVYLPNALFSTMLVINHTRMSHRRIEEHIRVRFEDVDKIPKITEEMRKEIAAHSAIDTSQPILIYFDSIKNDAFDISIDVYSFETRHAEFLALKEELLIAMHKILRSHGAEIAYPTQHWVELRR